jgi:hypothetical protein
MEAKAQEKLKVKLKAQELFDKVYLELKENKGYYDFETARNCVLILIDENVKMLKIILNESNEIYQSLNTPKKLCIDLLNPLLKFWNEVKEEIINYENES